MFCEKCGAKIQENSKFCESCGAPITTNDINKSTDKINTVNTKAKNKKFKLSKKAELIIAVIAFVCIVGVNIFIFKDIFFGEKKVSSNINETNTYKDSDSKEEVKEGNDEKIKADDSIDKKENNDESSKKDNKDNSEEKKVNKDENSDKEEVDEKEESKEYIHKYELIQSNLNWEDAKKHCENLGGHLATITSKEEEEKVLAIVNNSDVKVLWLGANDLKANGNFKWINGEDFSYHNWAVNEPNNDNGVEHYLVLYKVEESWLWNDGPINTNEYYKAENIGFICEYEVEQED